MKLSSIVILLLSAIILLTPLKLQAEEDPTTDPGYYPKKYIKIMNPLQFNLPTLREGRRLYDGHCKICHGVYGDGEGNAAIIGKFKPMPRDFTDARMSKKTDGMLYYSISKGIHGTRMFAREEIMPPKQRWTVIHYIRTFQKSVDKEK